MENKQSDNKKSGGSLLGMALAAALASSAGFMYVTHKEKIDREAKKQVEHLAKLYKESRPEIEKKVKHIWGEVSKNGVSGYLQVRSMLLHAMEDENFKKGEKMVRREYEKLVDKVMERAAKKFHLPSELEEKLSKVFKMDWSDVQETMAGMMAKGAKETVKALQKAKVSSQVKKVEKRVMNTAKKMEGAAGKLKKKSATMAKKNRK